MKCVDGSIAKSLSSHFFSFFFFCILAGWMAGRTYRVRNLHGQDVFLVKQGRSVSERIILTTTLELLAISCSSRDVLMKFSCFFFCSRYNNCTLGMAKLLSACYRYSYP